MLRELNGYLGGIMLPYKPIRHSGRPAMVAPVLCPCEADVRFWYYIKRSWGSVHPSRNGINLTTL
jgi:hypothetical protein